MFRKLLFLGLVTLSSGASAQTACPVGVPVGSPQCGPSPTLPRLPPRRVPLGRWQHTWGAIAIDEVKGSVGTSVDMDSKRAAEEEAMRRCIKPGTVGCKVRMTYYNQCAALAWPDQTGRSSGLASGPVLETVKALATSECLKLGARSCNIVYAECTDSRFIRY